MNIDRPLSGISVAELGDRISVGAAGALLAQLGATVWFVERKEAAGGKWAHRDRFALGKEPLDGTAAQAAAEAADIVLTSSDIDDDDTDWLDEAGAIHIDITAFGKTGPMAGKAYSDALIQALGGVTDTNGQEDGPPFAVGAPILEYEAALYGAAAAVAALRVCRLGGPAQSADIALFDCAVNSLPTFLPAYYGGTIPKREGNRHPLVVPWNSFETKDGHVLLCTVSDDHFKRLCELIDRPEIPESILDMKERLANRAFLEEVVTGWTMERTVAECAALFDEAGLASGPITLIDGLADEANLAHRESLLQAWGGAGEFLAKAPLFRTSGWTPAQPGAVKARGTGNGPGLPAERAIAATAVGGPNRPLDGIRVIEFGQYTTAPLAARHMAALGAEVIKVEPVGGDAARDWTPAREGLSYYFMFSNADKQSLAVNVRSDEGKALVRDLVASADILVQNMKPGSLDRLGFGWQDIQRINPRMVYLAISGFGADSAYEGRPAVDTIVQGGAGLMDLTRDRGYPLSTGISYSDIIGGQTALLAALAGLELRDATGRGQDYDISMQDTTVWVTETAWDLAPDARGPDGAALECSDGYVWFEDPAEADGIDTKTMTRAAVFAALAPKGVALAPILDIGEVARHPQTEARGLIVDGDWPGEPWPLLGSPIKLSATPPRVDRPITAPQDPTPETLAQLGLERESAAE